MADAMSLSKHARAIVLVAAFAAAQAMATSYFDVGPGVTDFVFHPTDPKLIYAGTDAGVLVSRDQGLRWKRLRPGVVTSLVMHPNDPSTLFAAVDGQYFTGLHQTSDGGQTWKRLPLPTAGVRAFAIDRARPQIMFAITSTDWPRGSGFDARPLPGDSSFDERMSGHESPARLHRSANGGASWQTITLGHGRRVGGVAITPNGTILVGSDGVVLRSSDDGRTWRESPRLQPDLNWISDLHVDSRQPNVVYSTSGYGDIVSGDGGATWTIVRQCRVFAPPERASLVFRICADPNRKSLIGGLNPGGLLQKSADGGASWTHVRKDFDAANIASHPLAPNVAFATYHGGGVYRSVDGGASWKAECTGIIWKDLLDQPRSGNRFIGCADLGGIR